MNRTVASYACLKAFSIRPNLWTQTMQPLKIRDKYAALNMVKCVIRVSPKHIDFVEAVEKIFWIHYHNFSIFPPHTFLYALKKSRPKEYTDLCCTKWEVSRQTSLNLFSLCLWCWEMGKEEEVGAMFWSVICWRKNWIRYAHIAFFLLRRSNLTVCLFTKCTN